MPNFENGSILWLDDEVGSRLTMSSSSSSDAKEENLLSSKQEQELYGYDEEHIEMLRKEMPWRRKYGSLSSITALVVWLLVSSFLPFFLPCAVPFVLPASSTSTSAKSRRWPR